MAYENLRQTVNDYERESINIADNTYNQLTAQMDKTLADIDAFLKTGKEDAATRAAFETAEGNLQSEKLKSSVKTDTAKIMGSAGAGVRSGMAKDTLKKANREYDITSKKAKADIGAYKANAALNISSQKLDVYQNSASMKSDAAAQAYEQIMNDRQFEYKKEQDAIDNALANQRLELDKQQFEFKKQKLENEKMAAAIGVANNLIQETTIENPETGEKETVQYYDFDQNGEMSAAERSLYVEDKGQRNYLNALKSIGMATSVDEISQSLYNMQTDLFGSGIDRVTGEIASWDNYSGFNDEYAKQLYMNFGLTDAEATEMMHEAKAMCFLNNYASGESGIVLGMKNEDGTYQNEQFYRDSLLSTGISSDRADYYLDIMKKNWDSSLDSVNEIKQEIYNAESRQQEIDKEIDSIIPTLNAQKGYEYYWGLVNEQKSLQNQLILIGQSRQYSQEADNLRKRYAEVTNEINKINNRFSGVDLNNKTMSQEYAKADPAYDQVENLRNEKNNLTTLKNQYKDTYWFYTDGSQYGIIDKILSDKIGREKLDDFVGKVTSMTELDQIAAPQILALFTQDKAVGEAVKSVFGEENLQENLVGYLKWCSVLGQQEAMEADYLDGTGVGWKSIAGLSSAIGRLFLSLQAGLANLIEGGVDIWEENNQSLDEYTPNIKSFYQMADLKLQLIQEEASEAMYEINPVWGFIYSTGVSLAQNAATLGIAVAANLILPGAGSAVSAMLMSANSFNDTYNSVRMDGGSASQALTMGIISGAAEYVFEKLSIGKLLDTPAAKGAGKAFWKSMAKASLADMGFNAMEEMNTEIANVIGEVLVLDNLSEYEKQKQYYMNVEGKTDDVAAALAFRDQVGRVLLAGGQGAIAGGVMGGTIARVKMAKAESKVGKAVQKSGNVSSMIKQGLNANADSEAYKIASQLNEKIKNKGKVSNQEVGALARAIAAETQAASAGLSGVDDGVTKVSKETALSNVSSGKVSVSDINTFIPGNEDARAYFKEQTGIELSNNPKTAFAQIVEYVATKTGKTTEQVVRELLSNAETSVDVTQKTIASLKSSGDETNVKVAEAFEFLNSKDGVRMLEMQKNNQQPSNGTDAELYQQMLTAKQVIENNRGTLEQGGYEIGTVDFNGIDVPVVVPKGYSDNARAEAVKYVNEQESTANTEQQTGQQTEAKTEKQTGIKTDSENVNKEAQKQLKGSVNEKSGPQSESTQTNSDSNTESKNEKVKKRTITKKNGDTTVIREKETTSKNKAFKKAKQVSRVETVGKTSARYDYTEVDTSNIYDSEMMDEINVAKEIAKAAGAKNIVFISGDVYIDGKKVRAQGFHSIGGTIFVNVDKSSLYARTIGHEVYHQIRQTNKAGLKAYEDIVRNIIEKGESSEFDFGQRVLSSRRAKEIIDAYKNNDSTMSKDALFEEVCAEFAGEIMTNPVVARALAAADTRAGNAFLRMTKKILAKIQGKENLSDYYNRLSDVEKALVDGIRSNSSKAEVGIDKNMQTKLQIEEMRANEARFASDVLSWYKLGRKDGIKLDIGSTSPVFRGLGAIESDIYIRTEKVNKILNDHPEITIEEIQKIPKILNNPHVVLKSKNVIGYREPSRVVVFGAVKGKGGTPVAVILDLRPTEKGFVVNNMQKVVSVYERTQSKNRTAKEKLRMLLSESEYLYINKKRTARLHHAVGLQSAYPIETIGSYIGSITYSSGKVNIEGKTFSEIFDTTQTQYMQNASGNTLWKERSVYNVPKSLFDNAPTTKFQLEDSKGFEQIRHLYDTVTDEEYSMISEWLKEFDKKHGDQNLYGIVNALEEKTFASIIKVIDNAKLFNKEAMSFFKDNFDVAYINMETYDNATAYLLDYAGEKLNDVSSRIAGIDTEEPSYRALVEQISRDVMETGIGASQSTRDDIFNYIVKKSKKDMANEAKQYEKLSKFFAENKLIANQDTLSVGNTILSMNGTTIDDYYKSLQREFGKEMFPNLSGDKGKVDQIKYYVGMVDDYNISKTILGGKDIDIYNAYVRTVVNDAIDTTEKNMMYAYRIATEPKMAQKDFDAYKLYRQALAEGASGILSLNQKRDDIKSQIKRIEYGSSLSPQAREYLTLVRKNGKKQVSTSNNREAIKEIYSISKKLIDLYDQLGRADRAITRTLKGRKSAMYTFIKSLIRNPNQYRNLNRAHASLISLENIIDLTMGADAQMFKDIIVAQYSENESARLRALNMYRVPAADAINKYNIDPNSERGIKIGSVIQLLGEGIIVEKDGKYEISKTAPRDMIYYTDKKGGKGFLQSISKKQFNGLKEVESTGLKGKVEKAVSSKTKDRIRERMVDLNEYVNSISNEDMIAVREISSAMSGVYEDLYRSLTDTLIRNGYPPIKHRANYFPHYIKDGMSTAETIADFVSSFTAGDLPTGVDGNTRDRKPGKKWFGNLLERTGDSTTVNAFVGFDKYLNGASHVIYHTEDIQLRRAAADMLGNKIEMEKLETLYALDTIFDSNDDRREAEGLMEAMRTRLHSDPTYNNTIVTALTRNANAIAGKTTNLDRDFGDILGRNVLQSIEKFNRFVGRGMVGFNLRSALTNIITIPQLTGTVKMTNIAKAIRDVAQYDALRARNETMEFLESNSSFLYNRVYSQHGKKYSKGYIRDTSQNLSDKNGLWQKYNNAAFAFMNLSDSYTAKVVTAAYYNEAIDRGMTGVQAERFASEGARKLMASRVKGEMPQIFNNRVLGIFTMFQLENSNMFRFLTSDIASYAGTGSGRVGRIIRRLAAFFISEALFEYLLEMLTGSNYRVFSFNPITLVADASVGKKNAMDIMKDLAADIPFIGGAIGEGGRYATSSVIDTWRDLLSSASKKGIIEFFTGRLSKADYVDISTKLISVLPIAGAGQAKKTIQGIADLSRGGKFGPYTTTNDDGSKSYDEKLYYAIDQEDPANFRAVLFGRSSVKEANEYWDSGLGPLSVQATKGYKEAVKAGMKNTQVYKVYRDVSVLRSEISEHNKNNPNKKRNANDEVKKLIRALDATNEQKEILWKNLTTLKNYGSVFSD